MDSLAAAWVLSMKQEQQRPLLPRPVMRCMMHDTTCTALLTAAAQGLYRGAHLGVRMPHTLVVQCHAWCNGPRWQPAQQSASSPNAFTFLRGLPSAVVGRVVLDTPHHRNACTTPARELSPAQQLKGQQLAILSEHWAGPAGAPRSPLNTHTPQHDVQRRYRRCSVYACSLHACATAVCALRLRWTSHDTITTLRGRCSRAACCVAFRAVVDASHGC